jgi:hypothetical protein
MIGSVSPKKLWCVVTTSCLPWMLGIVCTVGCIATLTAQTPPNLACEAASIKPNNSTSLGRRFGVPGDRFVATNETLWQLIAVAYGASDVLPQPLADYQISGGPRRINSDRFDVVAKRAADLRARRDRRDRTLGPKLRRSEFGNPTLRGNPNNPPIPLATFGTPACDVAGGARCSPGLDVAGVFKGGAMTTTELTVYLAKWLDRPVLDRTGLAATFDVEFQFSPEGLPGAPTEPPGVERPPSEGPSIFTAVREQLGLKLESTKGAVDVLVIDQADKPTKD